MAQKKFKSAWQSWKAQFSTYFGGRENLEMDLSNLCSNADVRKTFCLIFLRLWKCIKLFRALPRSSKTKSCSGSLCAVHCLPFHIFLWLRGSDAPLLISKSWGRLRKPKTSSKSSNLDGVLIFCIIVSRLIGISMGKWPKSIKMSKNHFSGVQNSSQSV